MTVALEKLLMDIDKPGKKAEILSQYRVRSESHFSIPAID